MRLMAMMAAALLPIALFMGVGIVIDFRETMERAREEVRQSAALAAARFSVVFDETRVLLDALRQVPGVQAEGGLFCDTLVTRLRDANPQFHTMGVMNANGTIVCHNMLRKRQQFGDVSLVRRIMAKDAPEFLVGNFNIGKVSRKPTVVTAMALPKVNGKVPGAVFVGMDLGGFTNLARQFSEDGRRAVTLVEPRTSRVLARWPNTIAFGSSFTMHPMMAAIQASPKGGEAEVPELDKQDSVVGFAPVAGAATAGAMLVVGVATEDIVAPVRSRGIVSALIALTILALVLCGAWWLGYWTQIRPIHRLTKIAGRIGAGDFDARTTIESWQAPEFRTLGQALDSMAGDLATGKRAEEVVAASEARYRLLAENSSDLITCLDVDGLRVFVSPASRTLLGLEPEALEGKHPRAIAHPDDIVIVDAMMRKLDAGQSVSGIQYRIKHANGHYLWVEVGGTPLEAGNGIVLVIRDISRRKLAESKLEQANQRLAALASTDGLTGLANRRVFDEKLASEFGRSLRDKSDFSLLLIDVDHFKKFNDTYGHPEGDECLRQISAVLRIMLRRPGDMPARYGGEEFAAVLPNTGSEGATRLGESLCQAVRDLNIQHAGSERGVVSISIGVASLSSGAGYDDAAALLKATDGALYQAKSDGRDRVVAALQSGLVTLPRGALSRSTTSGHGS